MFSAQAVGAIGVSWFWFILGDKQGFKTPTKNVTGGKVYEVDLGMYEVLKDTAILWALIFSIAVVITKR